ncbi:Uma2 family endonuclease [Tautonia marina]|uniref:Uma2 family endonuclease n=1 Tax=Tautonia marina TaxID=2653855 RepID=UPI0012603F2D|nr:Uma2 family endonuclease [Tautonia marina]
MATATRPDATTIPEESIGTPLSPPPVVEADVPADDFVPPSSSEILFEVIDGVVVECPPMGSLELDIANYLAQELNVVALSQGLGQALVEQLFRLRAQSTNRRRPDIAFVSTAKWPRGRRVPRANAWEMAPDLAVEVVSPSDLAAELDRKLVEYFEAGVSLVWVVYPETRRVFVFSSATEVRILSASDELDGCAVVPGFRLALTRLFDGDPEPQPAPQS